MGSARRYTPWSRYSGWKPLPAQMAYFDRIERECPRLFRGESALTDRYGAEWSRTYHGLDARLETKAGRAVLAPFFRLVYQDLGNLSEWESDSGTRPVACRS